MGKKIYLGIALLAVLGILFFSFRGSGEPEIPITIYKSPTCGCCIGYSGELGRNNFDVNVVPMDDMDSIKSKYNIPSSMESCHTSFVDGYVVEGHVPLEAVKKLLKERPDIDGIAMPGMPSGAPGMPGVKRGDWVVYSIKDGKTEEFMRI